MHIHDRTFNLLPIYHQKHYICTFSENCSATLSIQSAINIYSDGNRTQNVMDTNTIIYRSDNNRNHDDTSYLQATELQQ